MKKEKNNPYEFYIPPTIPCKYCNEELTITDHSKSTIETKGPYNCTYLYKCDCTPHDIQVLPIDKYPTLGTPLKGMK